MAAPEMGEDKSNLASQCMAFCQALASKGQIFSFTLKVGSSFAFSLDTRENGSSTLSKKRKSPSTRRRNARRRAEFLAKKRGPPESESSTEKSTPEKVARPVKAKEFKCDQCDKDFKSENGLKIHVGKTHNRVDSDLATPEVARNQLRSSESLSASPLLNTSREESAIQQKALVGDLSTNAPLTCAVSFDAQKKPKNRRGIGNKCRSSSTGRATTRRATGGLRTLYSVNKVQTCMISYELF